MRLPAFPRGTADIFVAGSSGVNFAASYLAATYLPASAGAEVSYAIYFAQLWAGIFGVILYNIVRMEEPGSGADFRFRWEWLIVPALLSILWLNAALVILLMVRLAIVRGGEVPLNNRPSARAALALVVFGGAAIAAVTFGLYRFYALLACVASLSVAFMTWRHMVWVVSPARLLATVRKRDGFLPRVLLRSSLDIYIFLVSVVLLSVVRHTTDHGVSADFVKIYSAMAIAGLFVAVIEARVLNTDAGGPGAISWPACCGMAAVAMALVFAWTFVIIQASIQAGLCAALGSALAVLSGNLLARIRRGSSPRSMMGLSIVGGAAMLVAFSPLVFMAKVELEAALLVMLVNLVLQFAMLLAFYIRLGKDDAGLRVVPIEPDPW